MFKTIFNENLVLVSIFVIEVENCWTGAVIRLSEAFFQERHKRALLAPRSYTVVG